MNATREMANASRCTSSYNSASNVGLVSCAGGEVIPSQVLRLRRTLSLCFAQRLGVSACLARAHYEQTGPRSPARAPSMRLGAGVKRIRWFARHRAGLEAG